MQDETGKRSLADVGEVVAKFRMATENIDAEWKSHLEDDRRYRSPSTAASDASLKGYDALVTDTLSYADLLIAAALDHASALITWGEGAARGDPTPVWAPWSVARSLVEVCATARWLAEVPLPTRERAGRALAIHRRDSASMIHIRQEHIRQDQSEKIAEAKAEAARLGIQIPSVPGHTFLVTALLSDLEKLKIYSMLSAAAHGEPWAITELDSERSGDGSAPGTYPVAMRSPAGLRAAIAVATVALLNGSHAVGQYRGWHR